MTDFDLNLKKEKPLVRVAFLYLKKLNYLRILIVQYVYFQKLLIQ
jgi:hypothetical protein